MLSNFQDTILPSFHPTPLVTAFQFTFLVLPHYPNLLDSMFGPLEFSIYSFSEFAVINTIYIFITPRLGLHSQIET